MEYALREGARYVLVANNDIAVDPATIRNLWTALEEHPEAGMAMPKIYHYYGDQRRLWCPGAYWRWFPPEVKMQVEVQDAPRFNALREIDYAPSCCLLIRREALEQVGQFDTGYFFYYDDWDFSIRLRTAGYKILFVSDAKLWHKVSVSTQKSEKPAQWWRVMGRSTALFYLRHTTPWTLFLFAMWFVVRESAKLQFGRIPPFLAGLSQGLRNYPRIEKQYRPVAGQ
jgi:GT2 family glycosyltransferase